MGHKVIVGKQPQSTAYYASARITTLLICRNRFVHAGLGHILSDTPFALADDVVDPATDVSAVAEGKRVLILLCESLSPDEYLKILERLKIECPSAWVVILADHLEPEAVVRLYKAGLNGLCSPSMAEGGLVKALELVATGETFLPSAVALALLERPLHESLPESRGVQQVQEAREVREPPAVRAVGRLSKREVAILQCLMQGESNKVIARRLDMAEATVKVHIKSILRKIQATNRTQAAMWARQHLQMENQHPG